MCVAIYKPSKKDISEETLKRCFDRNKDSAGYMFHKKGNLLIKKFLVYEDFLASYKMDEAAYPETDFAIHFRIATSGKTDLANCHPFRVTNKIGLIHNGVLSKWKGNVKHSDTSQFSEDVAPLVSNNVNWGNELFWDMLGETIGSFNKMIFMRNDGDVAIVNERKGTWKGGIWFSNMNWDFVATNIPKNKKDKPWESPYYARMDFTNRGTSTFDWDGGMGNTTICRICQNVKHDTFMTTGDVCLTCNADLEKEVNGNKKTSLDAPKWAIKMNLKDIQFFKGEIQENDGRRLFTYMGETYLLLVRETAEDAKLELMEWWLTKNRSKVLWEAPKQLKKPETTDNAKEQGN